MLNLLEQCQNYWKNLGINQKGEWLWKSLLLFLFIRLMKLDQKTDLLIALILTIVAMGGYFYYTQSSLEQEIDTTIGTKNKLKQDDIINGGNNINNGNGNENEHHGEHQIYKNKKKFSSRLNSQMGSNLVLPKNKTYPNKFRDTRYKTKFSDLYKDLYQEEEMRKFILDLKKWKKYSPPNYQNLLENLDALAYNYHKVLKYPHKKKLYYDTARDYARESLDSFHAIYFQIPLEHENKFLSLEPKIVKLLQLYLNKINNI